MQHLGATSETTEWSPFVSNNISITVIQVYASTTNVKETEINGFMKIYKTF